MLHLKSLELHRANPYASNPENMGALIGTLELAGSDGSKTQLVIKPEHVAAIVSLVADALVATAHSHAALLRQEVIENSGSPLIEGGK
jgi:hypothetical protein